MKLFSNHFFEPHPSTVSKLFCCNINVYYWTFCEALALVYFWNARRIKSRLLEKNCCIKGWINTYFFESWDLVSFFSRKARPLKNRDLCLVKAFRRFNPLLANVSFSHLYFKQFVFIRIHSQIFVRTLRRVPINILNAKVVII